MWRVRPVQLALQLASGVGDELSGCYFDIDADIAAVQAKSTAILEAGKRKPRLEMQGDLELQISLPYNV